MRVTLEGWANFYVIVGGSAGALTGLMFVVIALTREQLRRAPPHALRSFATPTIVHFTTVLSLAALLSMPRLTRASVGWILLGVGGFSIEYIAVIIRRARTLEYNADLED